jgi:hypothetical protein
MTEQACEETMGAVHRWRKSGDHPDDSRETFTGSDGKPFLGEGKVVRYYRTPELNGTQACPMCGDIMHNHGWIDAQFEADGGNGVVCPGDCIIQLRGKYYPIKPALAKAMGYDIVEPKEQRE